MKLWFPVGKFEAGGETFVKFRALLGNRVYGRETGFVSSSSWPGTRSAIGRWAFLVARALAPNVRRF